MGGVAVDQDGNIYASDFYNHRIQKFDRDGQFLLEWGEKGRTRGRFQYPTGLAISAQGEVVVADAFNGRIQIFTPDGQLLALWDPDNPALRYTAGIAVADSGTVYASDFYDTHIRQLRCE